MPVTASEESSATFPVVFSCFNRSVSSYMTSMFCSATYSMCSIFNCICYATNKSTRLYIYLSRSVRINARTLCKIEAEARTLAVTIAVFIIFIAISFKEYTLLVRYFINAIASYLRLDSLGNHLNQNVTTALQSFNTLGRNCGEKKILIIK